MTVIQVGGTSDGESSQCTCYRHATFWPRVSLIGEGKRTQNKWSWLHSLLILISIPVSVQICLDKGFSHVGTFALLKFCQVVLHSWNEMAFALLVFLPRLNLRLVCASVQHTKKEAAAAAQVKAAAALILEPRCWWRNIFSSYSVQQSFFAKLHAFVSFANSNSLRKGRKRKRERVKLSLCTA